MLQSAGAAPDFRADVPISAVGDAFALSVGAADMQIAGANFNGYTLEIVQTRLNDLPTQAYILSSDTLPDAAKGPPQEGFPYKTLTLHFNDGVTAEGVITAVTVENAAFGNYGADDIVRITYDGHFTKINSALDGSSIEQDQAFTVVSHILKGAEDGNPSIIKGEYPDALIDYTLMTGALEIAADQGATLVIDQQPDFSGYGYGGGGLWPQNLVGYAWESPGFPIIIEGGGYRDPIYNPRPEAPVVPEPGGISLLVALMTVAAMRRLRRPARPSLEAQPEAETGPAPQEP